MQWVHFKKSNDTELRDTPFEFGPSIDNSYRMCVARAWHEGDVLVGYVAKGDAYFAYEGKVVKKDEFYVLYDNNCHFIAKNTNLPNECSLVAGYTRQNKPIHVGLIMLQKDFPVAGIVLDNVCYAATHAEVVKKKEGEFNVLRMLDYKKIANQ